MRLSPADVLRVWEAGTPLHDIDRAIVMAAAAQPAVSPEEFAALPLGELHGCLAKAYLANFGSMAPARDACPACGGELEFDVPCADLAAHDQDGNSKHTVRIGSITLEVRPVNSLDFAAAAKCGSTHAAERELLSRAVVSAKCKGEDVPVDDLPPAVREAVSDWLEKIDPQADVELRLSCAACGHEWTSSFDMGRAMWAELAARAERLLMDIHELATRYGWTEDTILALSAARRTAYLQLGGAP